MNIFKILANGHGNVSETNVSAFLGYLLDPKEDHGLRDELLKRVMDLVFDTPEKLKPLFKEKIKSANASFRDLIINRDIFVDVLFEKAFDGNISSNDPKLKELLKQKEKQIVDIIIVIYRKSEHNTHTEKDSKKINQRKSIQKTIVTQLTPVATVLIENKIAVRPTPGQILKQAIYTHATINCDDELRSVKEIYSIFLTPPGNEYEIEWTNYTKDDRAFKYTLETGNEKKHLNFRIKGEHILWSGKKKDSSFDENISQLIKKYPVLPELVSTRKSNMYKILSDIIEEENNGTIDPISEVAKHTIKSFMNFINSDFSSINGASVFSNNMHNCSRFDFYKQCLERKLRFSKDLLELFAIEKEVTASYECEISYTVGKDPMMTFYRGKENFFLRVQVHTKEYKLVGYDPQKDTIGSLVRKGKYARKNTYFFSTAISNLNKVDTIEFIRLGSSQII